MNCTPGMVFGTLFFGLQFPVIAIAPWLMPWYPPENAIIVLLPVAVLHSLMAASAASVPAGEQNCILALEANSGGRIENSVSTKRSFNGVVRSSVWSGAPDWIRSIIA